MEKKYKLDFDGQAVTQGDLNLLGETSALADDRVLAELLRMTPYNGSTVSRGIIPYRHTTSGNVGTVNPNGATGSVLVSPFRAVIGSRTAAGTDALKNWRDIRSAVSVAEGATSLTTSVSLAANSSGNARWDLVYAAVAVDVNGPTTTRLVKDPSSGTVAAQTISQYARTTVTLGVVTGTPSATPTWPSAPSDAGSTYYIPLAYVWVDNGFSSTTTVDPRQIAVVAPCLAASGGLQAADSLYTRSGSGGAITDTMIQSWSNTPPEFFLPSSLGGVTELFVAIDATTGSMSHAEGAIVDSRDWRGRLVQWMAVVSAGAGFHFPWNESVSNNTSPTRNIANSTLTATNFNDLTSNYVMSGMCSTVGNTNPAVAAVRQNMGIATSGMAANTVIALKCDSQGRIVVTYTGAPNCKVVFWLRFSSVIDGYYR